MMSRKSRLKFAIFVGGLMMVIPLSLIGVSLLAQFITYFQQGADPASIFRGHALLITDAAEMHWLSVGDYTGETPTRSEQEEIVAAYWLAWEALIQAQRTGDTSDMATYWSGMAYDQALAGMNQSMMQDHTGHRLKLVFFSDDGSVVSFRDVSFTIVQPTIPLTVSAQVVMTLDQGFWRVRAITLEYQ